MLLLGTGLVAWVFGSSVEGEGGGWVGELWWWWWK